MKKVISNEKYYRRLKKKISKVCENLGCVNISLYVHHGSTVGGKTNY